MSDDAFERAAIFRVKLAQRLGLPEGKDPENVGIALGPDDRLLVTMPLETAEKLLAQPEPPADSPAESAPPALSPGGRYERSLSVGRALLARMGLETTLVRDAEPPVTGVVCELASDLLAHDDEQEGFVRLDTVEHGRVEVRLGDVAEVRA